MCEILYKYLPPCRTGFCKDDKVGLVSGFFPALTLVASRPFDLNDPFEFAINIDYALTPENVEHILEKHKRYNAHEIAKEKNISVSDAYKTINRNLKNLKENPAYRESSSKTLYGNWKTLQNESFRILSLSKNKTSLLMWAHYAEEHKGFAVGLSQKLSAIKPHKIVFPFRSMIYEKEFTKFELGNPGNVKMAEKVFTTKSEEWAYEKEARIIYLCQPHENDLTKIKLEFAPEAVKEIIFGARMEDGLKKQMRDFCQNREDLRHVKFFQAEVSRTHYKLDFIPL